MEEVIQHAAEQQFERLADLVCAEEGEAHLGARVETNEENLVLVEANPHSPTTAWKAPLDGSH